MSALELPHVANLHARQRLDIAQLHRFDSLSQ